MTCCKPVFPESLLNGIDQWSLSVFNRFGQKVFESLTPLKAWDGTLNGELLPADTYTWQLTIRADVCGDKAVDLQKAGEILLLP